MRSTTLCECCCWRTARICFTTLYIFSLVLNKAKVFLLQDSNESKYSNMVSLIYFTVLRVWVNCNPFLAFSAWSIILSSLDCKSSSANALHSDAWNRTCLGAMISCQFTNTFFALFTILTFEPALRLKLQWIASIASLKNLIDFESERGYSILIVSLLMRASSKVYPFDIEFMNVPPGLRVGRANQATFVLPPQLLIGLVVSCRETLLW